MNDLHQNSFRCGVLLRHTWVPTHWFHTNTKKKILSMTLFVPNHIIFAFCGAVSGHTSNKEKRKLMKCIWFYKIIKLEGSCRSSSPVPDWWRIDGRAFQSDGQQLTSPLACQTALASRCFRQRIFPSPTWRCWEMNPGSSTSKADFSPFPNSLKPNFVLTSCQIESSLLVFVSPGSNSVYGKHLT